MQRLSGAYSPRPARQATLAAILALHAALLAGLVLADHRARRALMQQPRPLMLWLLREANPAPPAPVEAKAAAARPAAPRPAARPTAAAAPRAETPIHEFTTDDGAWVAARPAAPPGPGQPPPAYAEQVKARLVARLVYPQEARVTLPKGYTGDPKLLKRQCTIPYELVVDRNGQVLSHRIEPCGDDILDAAAEQALRQAGPFPPPPDLGADSYVIYGSAIYRVP